MSPERKPHQPDSLNQPIDLSGLKLYSAHERKHIAQIDWFAKPAEAGISFADWLAGLPNFLCTKRLRAAVEAIVAAHRADKPVVFAMGGHVVKTGCGPTVIDLMRRGVVRAVACNGSTAIHDMEIAMLGATSEDVGDTIRDGRFGMVRETTEFFAEAADMAVADNCGLGAAVGRLIHKKKLPHASLSILAAAAELDIPATVHVALGTDTVHMPGTANGAHLGQGSLHDFRILCNVVYHMGAGSGDQTCGVWCNLGSAVILPEVFLKAVSIARNLGADLDHLHTVNCDQIRHYRPTQNVISRPVSPGHGFDLTGPHEILIPLLRQAIIEELK